MSAPRRTGSTNRNKPSVTTKATAAQVPPH